MENANKTKLFAFKIPDNLTGNITFEANLKYWPFSQHLVNELLGKDQLTVDIVDMTSVRSQLKVTKEKPEVSVADERARLEEGLTKSKKTSASCQAGAGFIWIT